jgi:hypothetical protein
MSEDKSMVDSPQSTEEPETVNPQSEIKSMEAYHHPHVEKNLSRNIYWKD